jgi:thiol-disulfide isomerase/thioredoxin
MNFSEWYQKVDKIHMLITVVFILIVILLLLNYQNVNQISARKEAYGNVSNCNRSNEVNLLSNTSKEVSLADNIEIPKRQHKHNPKHKLVLYYVDWCGHCKNLKPEWKKIEDQCNNNSQVEVIKLNCEEADNKATCGLISGYPTVLLYKEGVTKPISFDKSPVTGQYYPRTSNGLIDFLSDNKVEL